MSRNYKRNSSKTGYKQHLSVSSGSSYKKASSNDMHPFGPMMAEETFLRNFWDLDEDCEVSDYCDDEIIGVYDEYQLKEGEEIQSYHYNWQTCLELETNAELESRLRGQIHKMERAYKAMCFQAMKWHYLMEDVESNEQIKKMFKDMQMIRRLTGSDNV